MLGVDQLQQLVAASRHPDTHTDLQLPQVARTAGQLVQRIKEGVDDGEEGRASRQRDLVLCFRVLRNAAATGPGTCAALLHLGLLDLAQAALDLICTAAIHLDWQLPAAVSQALSNLCNACSDSAADAWAALFPLHISMLAHVNAGPAQEATCLALLACCKVVPRAAASLAGQSGAQIMTALLCNHQRMLEQGEHIANFGLLACHLCFVQDLLPDLFQAVGPTVTALDSNGSGAGGPQPTLAQVALLETLCGEAHDALEAAGPAAAAEQVAAGTASMPFLVQVTEQLVTATQHGPLSPGQQQLLQNCLHLIRDICARDDSGRGLASCGSLVAGLQAAGFLPAMLAMLKALEPIQSPQRQRDAPATGESATASGSSNGIKAAELAPALAQRATRFPASPPYQGFRSDLLSVVANAAHSRPCIQSEVYELGGVELVLAQCQLDRQSPLAREWALWGVRNLCDGNAQAQEAIRQLQLCTAVDNEELQRLGVKLELDEHSGKLRVTKREGSGGATEAVL